MERLQHQVATADRVQISFDLYREAGRDAVLVTCPGFFQSKETPAFRRLASALASGCTALPERPNSYCSLKGAGTRRSCFAGAPTSSSPHPNVVVEDDAPPTPMNDSAQ